MKLLIVEDEPKTGNYLRQGLIEAGYVVDLACNGVDGLHLAGSGEYQLIILDVMLPGLDGWNVLSRLRAGGWQTPVLFLTARSSIADRVQGLELGADDYLAKPFEPRELLARIRNVLRRTEALPANLEPLAVRRARFSRWVFDLEHRHLVDPDDRVVVLSGAEFRLLRVFIAHANKVLSREQLVALSSGRNYEAQDRAIDLQVSRLRNKLGDDGGPDGLIKTVRNEGYVLASAVNLE